MKRLRHQLMFRVLFLVIGGAALVLNGCGGSDDNETPSADGGTINTAAEGGAAAGSGTAAATAGTGISDLTGVLGSVGGSALNLNIPNKPMNPLTKKDPKMAQLVSAAQKAVGSKAVAKAAGKLKAEIGILTSHVTVSDAGGCTDGGTWSFDGVQTMVFKPMIQPSMLVLPLLLSTVVRTDLKMTARWVLQPRISMGRWRVLLFLI